MKNNSINRNIEYVNIRKIIQDTSCDLNADNQEYENIERPEVSIIRNLGIDTTNAFGIWIQDPNGPHADFWLTEKSF